MVITITFPGCWVHIDIAGHYLTTVFPDGRVIASVPVEAKDRETALRYGYGDNWKRLWREHDLLHHWVATRFGHGASPTIWSVCHEDHPDALPHWARLEEEGFLEQVHRWLNCGEETGSLRRLTPDGDLNALRLEVRSVLDFEGDADNAHLIVKTPASTS